MISRHTSDQRPTREFQWIYVALAFVLAGAAVLRFWEIGTNFHFMGDEGQQSAAEWALIHGHLPLLGPGLSIGQMNLGPFFYYLAAGPLWLAGGSPVGPTVMVGFFGVATVALLFLYLRFPLGDWPALGASAVMAASFLMVEYSRRPWNPTPTPFFALLFLWSLVLWKRHSSRYVALTAGSLAILIQLQPVNIFLVVLFGVFLVLARPSMPDPAFIGIAVALVVIISAPLIIYDLSHNFANTQHWIDALLGRGKKTGGTHSSSIRVLFNLFNRAFEPRIVAISVIIAVVLCLAGLYAAFFDHDAVGMNWEVISPIILLGISALGFEVYRKQVFEQYMVCLFVIPFIFLACLLRVLWKGDRARIVAGAIVLALSVVGVRDVVEYSFVNPQVTVADAAVTSHDLQPDDIYGHVERVSQAIIRLAYGLHFTVRVESPINTDKGYDYVLARQSAPSASKTAAGEQLFILVEPPSFPKKKWPDQALVQAVRRATRIETIGLVKLYQVPVH